MKKEKNMLPVIVLGILLALFLYHVDGNGQGKGENSALLKVSDNIKFENAMQFYRLRNYDRALLEFKEYLEVFIYGEHRNEAYRCIAGIYFDMFEYEKSIMAYNSLYEESINTEEGIEAFYKTGICYQKMGKDDKAKQVFDSIIRQYPYSGYAHLSKIQMDLLAIIKK